MLQTSASEEATVTGRSRTRKRLTVTRFTWSGRIALLALAGVIVLCTFWQLGSDTFGFWVAMVAAVLVGCVACFYRNVDRSVTAGPVEESPDDE